MDYDLRQTKQPLLNSPNHLGSGTQLCSCFTLELRSQTSALVGSYPGWYPVVATSLTAAVTVNKHQIPRMLAVVAAG